MALAEVGARLRLEGAANYRRDAEQAARATGHLGEQAGHAERQVGRMERTARHARGSIGGLGKAAGAIGGIVGGIFGGVVGGFLKDAVSSASDLNETMSKTQVIFGNSTPAVVAFANNAAQSIGATKTEALDALSTFGSLFNSFGNSKADAQKMSLGLTQLAGDLASFNNADTSDALDAIRSGLLGESDPLQRFQINLSAAAIQAEAMSSGLVKAQVDTTKLRTAQLRLQDSQAKMIKTNKDARASDLDRKKAANAVKVAEAALSTVMQGKTVNLTNAQKAQATYNLIMRQSKSAQGDFQRTSSGLANSQRILRAEFANTKAEIGTKLLPIVNEGMRRFSEFVTQFKNGTGAAGSLRTALDRAYKVTKALVGFVADHPDAFKLLAAGIVTYKLALLGAAAANQAVAFWAPRAGAAAAASGAEAAAAGAAAGPWALLAVSIAGAGYALYKFAKLQQTIGEHGDVNHTGYSDNYQSGDPNNPVPAANNYPPLTLGDGKTGVKIPPAPKAPGVSGKSLITKSVAARGSIPGNGGIVPATPSRPVIHNHFYVDGKEVADSAVRRIQDKVARR